MGESRPIVLVVEDEPILRLAAIDMVEDAGFACLDAGNAEQAVEILERRADIRIVFTDINMPEGMDGMRLAACIRDRWPPISIILTSGHVQPLATELPSRSLFFAKPYRERDVVAAMWNMAA